MTLATLAFFFLSQTQPAGGRIFHYLAMIICGVAALSWFTQASNLGSTPIVAEFRNRFGDAGTRSIFYVRFVEHAIVFPLLALFLVLPTGLPLSDMLALIFLALVSVVSALIGALVRSTYKWGYFVFSVVSLLGAIYILFITSRAAANARGPAVSRSFLSSAMYLVPLFLLYELAWGLSVGGNVISVSGEFYFYGVLDFLALPVFCFLHIFSLKNLNMTDMNFNAALPGHVASTGLTNTGGVHSGQYEKGLATGAVAGTGAGLATHTNTGMTGTTGTTGVTGTHTGLTGTGNNTATTHTGSGLVANSESAALGAKPNTETGVHTVGTTTGATGPAL